MMRSILTQKITFIKVSTVLLYFSLELNDSSLNNFLIITDPHHPSPDKVTFALVTSPSLVTGLLGGRGGFNSAFPTRKDPFSFVPNFLDHAPPSNFSTGPGPPDRITSGWTGGLPTFLPITQRVHSHRFQVS